jgi:hypothetical protein
MATAEAPAVTVTPARVASPTNLELFAFFDATERLGYSFVDLFEHHTPGATAALVAWAADRGLAVYEKPYPARCEHGIQLPAVLVTSVSVPGLAARIAVHANVEAAS